MSVFESRIRRWEKDDGEPRADDVFQERLFCIRWVETYYQRSAGGKVTELTQNEVELIPGWSRLIETGERMLSGDGFASSLVRQVLAAVYKLSASEQAREGLNWLKTELPDYWGSREKVAHLLDFLAALRRVAGMEHWHKDADAAALLAGSVRNDHI